MTKKPEVPIRVSEGTKDQIRYMAGSLDMNQGEIVGIAMKNVIQEIRPELDELAQAFLSPKTTIEEIQAIRTRALGKLAFTEPNTAENT